jgi:hypothetical protein
MSVVYQTIVTVPDDFIEKILEKALNWKFGISARLSENQFAILAKNNSYPGIEEVIKVSRIYKDSVFKTVTTCDMDLTSADILTISNGEVIDERRDLWFDFIYDLSRKNKTDFTEIQKFETEARKHFNMIDSFLRRRYKHENFKDILESNISSMDFTYQSKGALFSAKRKDHIHVDVEIEIFGEAVENQSDGDLIYDGLPF